MIVDAQRGCKKCGNTKYLRRRGLWRSVPRSVGIPAWSEEFLPYVGGRLVAELTFRRTRKQRSVCPKALERRPVAVSSNRRDGSALAEGCRIPCRQASRSVEG